MKTWREGIGKRAIEGLRRNTLLLIDWNVICKTLAVGITPIRAPSPAFYRTSFTCWSMDYKILPLDLALYEKSYVLCLPDLQWPSGVFCIWMW